MAESKEIKELKEKILQLEVRNKHLTNELQLTEKEKEAARKNYFDIISNMEAKVTERTRETGELRKLTEAKSKELQIMLDSSPAMIFYKDSQNRYIRVNKAFSQTLGIPINKIIGKTFAELFPGSEKQFLEDDLEVMRTGRPVLNITGSIETRKGLRQVLTNKIPYKDISGKSIGIIGFALDVTDLRQAEMEKRELEDKLSQLEKMEAIGRLAGGVAHDLNNVLSAVVSYPDLLLKRMEADNPLRKPIETIRQSGQKAAAIVEDLLTLARRGVPVTEVLNLNDIIANYLESPEYETLRDHNPSVRIETRLEKNVFNIKGSPIHLTKTVMNLLSNAMEATLHKGTVILSTANRYLDMPIKSYDLSVKEGDYVVLTVEDTGIGIKPEDLKKIFEPFYTKKVMGRSGTGLGMAVVWGTVKDHKGNINVISEEGKGTTIELYFPVTREDRIKSEASVPFKEYMGNKERILVVDDMPEQREISTTLLETLNYTVDTVSGGIEAVEYLKTRSADLVILDMIMAPGIDGLDTYRRIVELKPGQKAIITSGYSETERVREAQRLGAGEYIKKPYTLEKIGLAVRKELAR